MAWILFIIISAICLWWVLSKFFGEVVGEKTKNLLTPRISKEDEEEKKDESI